MNETLRTRLKLLLGRGVRTSYSQFGEDAPLQALLREKKGIYIDVGAYHPILYSNTYALYRRGWHGLAIDPNVTLAPLYRDLRPRDTFLACGVGAAGLGSYHAFSDAAYNTFDDTEMGRRSVSPHISSIETREVPIRPLHDILEEYSIPRIDLLNIDVEGKNLEVLTTYNWSLRPRVLAVEIDTFNPDTPEQNETYTFLRAKGYQLVGFSGLTFIWS
jgi:FkbM family methyltransferase